MHRNLNISILSMICFLMFNFLTYADDNRQQLPENLEEIALDNIDRLVPLATFSSTEISDVAWS